MVLRSEFDKIYIEHRDGTYTPKKREKECDRQKETFVIPEGYYSSEQIATTYQMNRKTICRLCRENDIPKISHGGFNYYEQLSVYRFFAKYKAADNIKEWIGAEQMEEIYGMSKNARCSFVHRHKILPCCLWQSPIFQRPYRHHQKRWLWPTEKYYSVTEAMEKYGIRRMMSTIMRGITAYGRCTTASRCSCWKRILTRLWLKNPASENYSAQTRIIFSNGSHQHCFIVLVCNRLITK